MKEVKVDLKKSNKSLSLKILFLFILIGLISLGFLGYFRIQAIGSRVQNYNEDGESQNCTNILNPDCWTDVFKPQLKQSNGFTNVLILGIDSRNLGTSGSGLKNTDTMILASYNHATGKTMMVSIPRDFYVEEYRTKINAVYAFTYKKDPNDPFKYVKEMVGKIVGKEVNYLVLINLEGVMTGINEIGGVQVCPPEGFTARYPNDSRKAGESGWKYYEFPAGCQNVDGERALVYARFRHITKGPSSLASDFSRARRQQEVLESIKDQMLASDISITSRAENYYNLLQKFQAYVKMDLTFEDILAGLSLINIADKDPVNIVLDPTFGGQGKYIGQKAGPIYYIEARDKSYKSIQNELNSIWTYADFFKENPKILILNLSGAELSADNSLIIMKNDAKYTNGILLENGQNSEKINGIRIFDFSSGTKPKSIDYILKTVNGSELESELPETFGLGRSSNNEDILIVVGPESNSISEPSVVK